MTQPGSERSLTTLQEKVVKIGATVIDRAPYTMFQMRRSLALEPYFRKS